MRYQDFRDDPKLCTAADIYVDKYGGGFYGGEPGGELCYEPKDGETAYIAPADAGQVLRDLQGSQPITVLWPEEEYDPEIVY